MDDQEIWAAGTRLGSDLLLSWPSRMLDVYILDSQKP